MKLRALALALVMFTALLVGPPAANATTAINRSVVYVEDHTGYKWPVHTTTYWADSLSGASVRYGYCRTWARCIRVYERTIRSIWAAVTYVDWTTGRTTIYVNPQRNWYPWAKRNAIIHHEMGHAFCLLHVSNSNNLMYPYVGTTLYLTSWQKAKFRDCR